MYEKTYPTKRFAQTMEFLDEWVSREETILDLGVANPFSQLMKDAGYRVQNTGGEDLDLDYQAVMESDYQVLTGFEILEHLVSPFNLLQHARARKLVVSVPLKLWFASAYKHPEDKWDRHYHEFEDWQFDWLLEKAGWKIKARKKFTHPVRKIGIRPILRRFTPRYYLVYAERTP